VSNTQQTHVTWSATQGTISLGGTFTAPTVTATTTVRVTATSVEDPTKSAMATVTVMPPINVTVTPATATVTASKTLQFTGVAQYASDPAVTWSVTLGSISAQGLFTAPAVLIQTTATVTAASVQDPNRVAHAKVTVTPPASAPLTITTPPVPGTPVGSAYSFAMSASGGFTPYQWLLVSGEIPPGITLSSSGLLDGSATQVGQFTFSVKVTDAGNHHAQQSVKLVVSGSARGQVIPLTFFGLHIDWVNTPWPNMTFGAQRFWDSDTGWAQINTAPGVFDWTTMDARVNTTLANGVDILFDLARTPVWAQCASSNPQCGSGKATWMCTYNLPGQGGLGQCFPPADLNVDGTGANQHWIDWVTALASRYKGRIKYYEIWNEPTAPIMWQGTDPQLVRMAQDARCIVVGTGCSSQSKYTLKGIDPSAEITTPAYVSDTGINVSTAMSSFLSDGGGQYVDVIAYHGYVQWPQSPEQAVTDAASLQNVLAGANQQQKPLFSTEGGFGAKVTVSDPDQEAAWIARYVMLMQSIGIARSYWYAWDAATTPFWSPMKGTEVGGTTYSEMTKWLVGATLSSPCVAKGTVWQCGYTRPGGYQAIAVWDTSQTCSAGTCSTSGFLVPSGYTYSLDLTGAKTNITGSAVRIGIKPLLLENQ
jgi:polysaccharide biosynthesis protein PslG